MKKKTLTFAKANLISIPFFILIMSSGFALYLLTSEVPKEEVPKINMLFILPSLVVLFFLHELIHGLFFGIYAKGGFKTVKIGFDLKTFTPYCHCREAINVKKYRITCLMPTVFLGFIPAILGFILGEINTFTIGLLMISGGVGDFIALWMLKDFKKEAIVQDHPSEMGFLYRE